MKSGKFKQAWKVFEKWATKLFLILSVPALGCIIYLAILESKGSYSYDSSQDLPNRIIQGMMCPSLMVKGTPDSVDVKLHNTNPDTEPDVIVSINAPNFEIINPKETSMVEENLSSNWFVSPGWWVAPTKTGKQIVTISAITDDGISNSAICEITVIQFLGLDLQKIYGICYTIIYACIVFGIQSWREKRKQKEFSKPEAG